MRSWLPYPNSAVHNPRIDREAGARRSVAVGKSSGNPLQRIFDSVFAGAAAAVILRVTKT